MRRMSQLAGLWLAAVVAGCSDGSSTPASPRSSASIALDDRSASQNEHYVAIGTSISMGWASNGVYDASQRVAWPALLGFATDRGISLPLIQSPGCTSPLVAPLGAGLRLSGESIAGSTVCAPNDAGVVLPTQNVALSTALAADAVQTTPEASPYPWYGRVLPPGTTQLTAALGQNPTFVSVELGGNEVLGATSGLVVPGTTVVPLPFFTAPYDALLDQLSAAKVKAVLVGLPADARHLPALRRGDEIWADRAEFAALHVDVSGNCNGNQNYINVSVQSLNMALTGAFTSTHGLPNPVYSCADIPGTQDEVLTPADITTLNSMLAQMTSHIQAQASARGFAYFSLGVLYDAPGLKGGSYSIVAQLTSHNPFGLFVSLDGVHPTVLGHLALAAAAALATDFTYHNGAHQLRVANASLAGAVDEPMIPSVALAQAQAFARAHQNEQVAACPMMGECSTLSLQRVR